MKVIFNNFSCFRFIVFGFFPLSLAVEYIGVVYKLRILVSLEYCQCNLLGNIVPDRDGVSILCK